MRYQLLTFDMNTLCLKPLQMCEISLSYVCCSNAVLPFNRYQSKKPLCDSVLALHHFLISSKISAFFDIEEQIENFISSIIKYFHRHAR